jgi:hypothetical protein
MATKTDTAPVVVAAPKTAVKKAAKKAAAKKAAAPKRAARAKLDPKLVADAVTMLKSKKGATYAEIATALKLKSKGDKPHQSPAAQVRALVRDRVRVAHEITDGDFASERGGQVYLIK